MNLLDSHSAKIFSTIEKLRHLTQVEVQSGWRYYLQDLLISPSNNTKHKHCQEIEPSNWQPVELNEKGYITWSAGEQVIWLAQKFIVPESLQDYPITRLTLRLVLTWWAQDAQIFVNGQLVQQGDLFDSSARILLTPSATQEEEIIVGMRLVSPKHDIGGLMRSKLVYEKESFPDPGWVADELTILHKYLTTFEPEQLEILAAAVEKINWDIVSNVKEFERSLADIREELYPFSKKIKQYSLHLVGHAHLDMAWLWTLSETWEVAVRTFESVLSLQQDFPHLTFCHTTSALYAWIEKNRPDLFVSIQQAVATRRWEVLGGMWVEPDVNLVAGESIVRQLLYAQRYLKEKFGAISKVAWLPDSFGFCWQLPQIFKQSGIEYFVTGKLHWNDTNTFPHGVFWWRSPDGTELLTLISPPNLAGVMDTNPIPMSNYALDWGVQTGLKDALWLPGVGDHGGGPTRDMLEVHQRSCESPFFPRMEFTSAIALLQQIDRDSKSSIPVWNDELYLEFHRGCYTTHADQKRFNRRCEGLLYQAELWASLAKISERTLSFVYPKAELEDAWKKVLFNQFHDILPGTSITEVFIEANQDWQEVERVGEKILFQSLEAIASGISLPSPPKPNAKPIIIFNSLNWQRSEVVACNVSGNSWEIYDLEGQKLISQPTFEHELLFLAPDIPSVGYRVFWLCQENESQNNSSPIQSSEYVLENENLRVVIDPETGNLSSVFDKNNRKEILSDAGNQLQAFQDKGQYWDAWNIDPNYAQYPLPPAKLKSIKWLEKGPLQWRIQVVRQLGNSEFCQDYILQIHSPLIKIATTVNWQESHVLLKVAFPLTIESDRVTYEIPCGAIERSTLAQTPTEKAKWEVPALQWADLNNDEYGISLINDCKYGYDSQPNLLRLTLLRSSKWPDPQADIGIHYFTYALYPHQGNWRSANTVRRGYELNLPLTVLLGESFEKNVSKRFPGVSRLLDLGAENLILMALKPKEDDPETLIMRCYECHGELAELTLETDLELISDRSVDLLEEASLEQSFSIQPWKIASFELRAIAANPD